MTYYDTKNAFTAIENGGKLRKPDELPFDLCFGGRRQFCKTSYADLGKQRISCSVGRQGRMLQYAIQKRVFGTMMDLRVHLV